MAARKRAMLVFAAYARSLSTRSSPPALPRSSSTRSSPPALPRSSSTRSSPPAHAVVPRSSPGSGCAVRAEAARGFAPLKYRAFAGFAAVAGVSLYMLCVPTHGKVMLDDSGVGSSVDEGAGYVGRSADSAALNISPVRISHSNFRGPSSTDFKNLSSALRNLASELRKARQAENAKSKVEHAVTEGEHQWLSQLNKSIGIITTYFYLPETITDICTCLFAIAGGSVLVAGKSMDPTSSLLDPSMCFLCPFSGCLSLLPLYEEMSFTSSDPGVSEGDGESSHPVSTGAVTAPNSDAGDSNVTSEVGLQRVLAEDSNVKLCVISHHYQIGSNEKKFMANGGILETVALEFLSHGPHVFLTRAASAGVKFCGFLKNSVPVTVSTVQKQVVKILKEHPIPMRKAGVTRQNLYMQAPKVHGKT